MMTPATYVFDFDSTLVAVESLDELADIALRGNPRRRELVAALRHVTAQGMAGELTFDASLYERLQLFAASHAHIDALVGLLSDNLSPSIRANAQWFAANASRVYVVSGGFLDFILPVTRQLGLPDDHVFANRFTFGQDGLVSGFKTDALLCQPQGKAEQLRILALPRPLVMVGDGYTDYEPKQYGQADEFWCYTEIISRPNALRQADRVITSFDELAS